MISRPSQVCSGCEYFAEDRLLQLEAESFKFNFLETILQINLVFSSNRSVKPPTFSAFALYLVNTIGVNVCGVCQTAQSALWYLISSFVVDPGQLPGILTFLGRK